MNEWQQQRPLRCDDVEAEVALDDIDRDIIELSDGETSIQVMLMVLGLSEVNMLRRLRRLFAAGYLDWIESIVGNAAREARAAKDRAR